MADLERIVRIIFEGDDRDLGPTLSGMATTAATAATAIIGISTAFGTLVTEAEGSANIIHNSLALPADVEQDIIESYKRVFTQGIGDSAEDVARTAVAAIQIFSADAIDDLDDIVAAAIKVQDQFNIDVTDSIGAAKSAMDDFGIGVDAAFGMIITGVQTGMNASDDLTDTFQEYGSIFSDMGASATDFFNLLEAGFDPGVLGTDKVADALKEFSGILVDGGKDIVAAFDSIGIEYDSIIDEINSGSTSIWDVFQRVVTDLEAVPGQIDKTALAKAFFGTEAIESLGTDWIDKYVDVAKEGTRQFADALTDIDTDTLGQKWSSIWRKITTSTVDTDAGGAFSGFLHDFTDDVSTAMDGLLDILDGNIRDGLKAMGIYVLDSFESVRADAEANPVVVTGKIDVPEDILNQSITVEAVEGETVDQLANRISEVFPDEKQETINAVAKVDNKDAKKKVQEVIDKADEIENSRLLEIELKGEIDTKLQQIKTDGETAQAAFEYKAKVDVAQAQADAGTIKAMFDSVNVAINSTGDTLVGLFGMLTGDNLDFQDKWSLRDAIDAEQVYRKQAFEKQSDLIDAQIALIEARTTALENGDGLIKIDSTGLEPALELVMWEILEKVQVRASENVQEFLLGM